jgi:hypothetical protein
MLACVVNKKPTTERHLSMSMISMLSDSPHIWSLAKQQQHCGKIACGEMKGEAAAQDKRQHYMECDW